MNKRFISSLLFASALCMIAGFSYASNVDVDDERDSTEIIDGTYQGAAPSVYSQETLIAAGVVSLIVLSGVGFVVYRHFYSNQVTEQGSFEKVKNFFYDNMIPIATVTVISIAVGVDYNYSNFLRNAYDKMFSSTVNDSK